MNTIQIPTINDEKSDFSCLFRLYNFIMSTEGDIKIDFRHCKFLRQNAVAFLGGLYRVLESKGRSLQFDFDTMKSSVFTNLEQNGFTYEFGDGFGPWSGNSIPFMQSHNDTNIIEYLQGKWLGRGWVHISNKLRDNIVGNVFEIYANAFEHGHSPIGTFSCGQHFRTLKELKLTVIDFGVGIPFNVRNYTGEQYTEAFRTLEWAFVEGTSTRLNSVSPGGMGLGLLKEFIELNNGKLEIYSHDGYGLISKDKVEFENLNSYFHGTLVNITLKCDESYYRFKYEDDDLHNSKNDDWFLPF